MYTYDESPIWILNNVTVGNDTNVTTSAYWFNASDIGIYNITAKINESQVVWTVNVTSTPKTGLGDFVEETIIAAVVAVAAGYFWNRFRRRTF
jgi:phosphoribosyl-dephospho-CoA transferase